MARRPLNGWRITSVTLAICGALVAHGDDWIASGLLWIASSLFALASTRQPKI